VLAPSPSPSSVRLARVHERGDLALQRRDAPLPGPAHRVEARHVDPGEPGRRAQRRQDLREHDGDRARVRHDPARRRGHERGVVHHGDDERHVGLRPEGAGVVDDEAALLAGLRRQPARDVGRGREERDVAPLEGAGSRLHDAQRVARELQLLPHRPGGREEPKLRHLHLEVLQDLEHGAADGAGGPGEGDAKRASGHGGAV
jgi:hypothetical protein